MKTASSTQQFSVSADKLMEIFKSKEFYTERYNKSGINDFEITECGSSNGEFVIVVKRNVKVNMDSLPKVAQKFVGDTMEMNVIMRWKEADAAPYTGSYEVELGRVPVEAKGSMKLENSESGCTNTINLEVDCSIPFVGGKVEAAIAKKAGRGMSKDEEGTRAYLEANNIA